MDLESPKVKTVLAILAAGAFLSLAILAPNVPAALATYRKPWKKFNKRRLKQVLKRLKDQEVISFQEKDGDTIIKLTDKGKLKYLRFNLDNLKLDTETAWDGKWRLVIFDIPNAKKVGRELFRKKLKELGFFQLQKSVFLTPYKCQDEITFVKEALEVGPYVKYLEASFIEEADFYKSWFNL